MSTPVSETREKAQQLRITANVDASVHEWRKYLDCAVVKHYPSTMLPIVCEAMIMLAIVAHLLLPMKITFDQHHAQVGGEWISHLDTNERWKAMK